MSTAILPPPAATPWTAGLPGAYPGQRSVITLRPPVGARNNEVKMFFCWCPLEKGSPAAARGQSPERDAGGFWLAQHPVNQAQWRAVMGTDPSEKGKGDAFPVDTVSWDDAQEFCEKFEKFGGIALRLPTEAEWEHACRAGTTTEFALGGGECLNSQLANFNGNNPGGSGRDAFEWLCRERTVTEGSFPPNAWGLHDMHGQLLEWCDDWTDAKERRFRVLRGGSWVDYGEDARSGYRFGDLPGFRGLNFGFRPCPSSTSPAGGAGKAGGRKFSAERKILKLKTGPSKN